MRLRGERVLDLEELLLDLDRRRRRPRESERLGGEIEREFRSVLAKRPALGAAAGSPWIRWRASFLATPSPRGFNRKRSCRLGCIK